MRVMAIDYGDARTGVAFSDLTGSIVGHTTVVHEKDPARLLTVLAELARTEQAEQVVMGFPRNMDGTEGPRAALYRDFAARLEEALARPVILWDERRTTVDAHRILSEQNIRGKKRKNTVDAVAASLILEGYLRSQP